METSFYHMKELDKVTKDCEVELIKKAYPLHNLVQYIMKIKGINSFFAILIISEIGVDINQFTSKKQFVS